ncbi:hypothetical protein SKAU_G00301110 [Synaphobranchus kaupii]|uniref:Uncharacterized protein n=1 Tax=Synaphobranchus kaupii TaxID=118154 RepID=A0A9Q1EVR8_SYNKA|nr:hypothetical protein SKAU_G00301110 [Synaphobranchus kaupii]
MTSFPLKFSFAERHETSGSRGDFKQQDIRFRCSKPGDLTCIIPPWQKGTDCSLLYEDLAGEEGLSHGWRDSEQTVTGSWICR